MSIATERTVGELAVGIPGAARAFERLGIDYCCGGKLNLEQACRAAGLGVDEVTKAIEAAEGLATAAPRDTQWQAAPLVELISHIKSTHHQYVREEISRLNPLFHKVCAVHGERHPELLQLRDIFQGLAQELTTHLMKEEMVLFPCIERMEKSAVQKEPFLPPPFGTVQNPISMMEHEHDSAGAALQSLRDVSNGYFVPPDACASYQALYQGLADFQADLHQHIHLENNILFPRAIKLENAQS